MNLSESTWPYVRYINRSCNFLLSSMTSQTTPVNILHNTLVYKKKCWRSWSYYFPSLLLRSIVRYFQIQLPYRSPPMSPGEPPPSRSPSPPPRALPPSVIYTKTPYDEDEIAEIVTKIYEVPVELCYISAEDIAWPASTGPHAINEELCKVLNLDPVVISLMKRIPYPKDQYRAWCMEFVPYSRPWCYLEDGEIRKGREPAYDGVLGLILLQDIVLTTNPRDGETIVIDTKESQLYTAFSLPLFGWRKESLKLLKRTFFFPSKFTVFRLFFKYPLPSWTSQAKQRRSPRGGSISHLQYVFVSPPSSTQRSLYLGWSMHNFNGRH